MTEKEYIQYYGEYEEEYDNYTNPNLIWNFTYNMKPIYKPKKLDFMIEKIGWLYDDY